MTTATPAVSRSLTASAATTNRSSANAGAAGGFDQAMLALMLEASDASATPNLESGGNNIASSGTGTPDTQSAMDAGQWLALLQAGERPAVATNGAAAETALPCGMPWRKLDDDVIATPDALPGPDAVASFLVASTSLAPTIAARTTAPTPTAPPVGATSRVEEPASQPKTPGLRPANDAAPLMANPGTSQRSGGIQPFDPPGAESPQAVDAGSPRLRGMMEVGNLSLGQTPGGSDGREDAVFKPWRPSLLPGGSDISTLTSSSIPPLTSASTAPSASASTTPLTSASTAPAAAAAMAIADSGTRTTGATPRATVRLAAEATVSQDPDPRPSSGDDAGPKPFATITNVAPAVVEPVGAPMPADLPASAGIPLAGPQWQPGTPALPSTTEMAPLAATPGTPEWNEGFADRVTLLLHAGRSEAEITLHPADLGPVEVRIRVEDGLTRLQFDAPRPETRQAIEDALPRLREMMEGSGLSLGQTQVGSQGRQDDEGSRRQSAFADRAQATQVVEAVRVPEATRRVAAALPGRVDTFV